VSRSMHALQAERLPYNHHLHQFLTFLKHERGFADATIVNRERSLKPFLAWLVAQDVPLSTVSPVVITKYFISAVAGKWRRTTVSFHVQSLRSFFRYASSRGWCAAGIADAPRRYTYENLPQGPSWEEVGKLLADPQVGTGVTALSRLPSLPHIPDGSAVAMEDEFSMTPSFILTARAARRRRAMISVNSPTRGMVCGSRFFQYLLGRNATSTSMRSFVSLSSMICLMTSSQRRFLMPPFLQPLRKP